MKISRIKIKFRGALVQGVVRLMPGILPLYVVNEYPKSGGTWIGQMLARGLNLPFPRNQLPRFRSAVIHGHFLSPWGMKNVFLVLRDGRDVMVSWYHHCLFVNERENSAIVQETRRDLPLADYENVRENLPVFIEYAFTRQRHPGFSWVQFVQKWFGRPGITLIRYEDVRRDPAGELRRIIREGAAKTLDDRTASEIALEFSFERQSGRSTGQEKRTSFMRKGIVGDWKNHFSKEAREVFHHYAGGVLVRLGYEKDNSWV